MSSALKKTNRGERGTECSRSVTGLLVCGTPLGEERGNMCVDRTRRNPPSLSWAHSMKGEHQQIQQPTLVVVCSRPCPVGPTFCSVGFPKRLAPTHCPSQAAAGDQVFLEAPSLPKPLWMANAGSQAPYPLHLLLRHRHQSLTPSAFPFYPRHQASVPALYVVTSLVRLTWGWERGELIANMATKLHNLRLCNHEQERYGNLSSSCVYFLKSSNSVQKPNFLPAVFLREPALRAPWWLRELKSKEQRLQNGLSLYRKPLIYIVRQWYWRVKSHQNGIQ